MSEPVTLWTPTVDALEVRNHLLQLQAERALAVSEGLGAVAPYMADLEAEIHHHRELYVAAVVTEIATLRAELFGPETG